MRPHFYRGYRPGLGPRLKKCGLRLHGPIVARIRPRKKTRPKKPRPKAQRALGRVFWSYGRVFKTRPQKHFFVVISKENPLNSQKLLLRLEKFIRYELRKLGFKEYNNSVRKYHKYYKTK